MLNISILSDLNTADRGRVTIILPTQSAKLLTVQSFFLFFFFSQFIDIFDFDCHSPFLISCYFNFKYFIRFLISIHVYKWVKWKSWMMMFMIHHESIEFLNYKRRIYKIYIVRTKLIML